MIYHPASHAEDAGPIYFSNRLACQLAEYAIAGTLPWARPHLAFDPSGRPLFTLGYSLQAYSILLHFSREP